MRQDSTVVAEANLEGRSVLVVDDSEDNQLLVKLLLLKRGMRVESAGNGREAIDVVAQGSFDLILMDMQMPIMDGYAATRQLRESGYKKPIIALTAHAMKEDRERCLGAGCDEYLTKPIDTRVLYAKLASYLKMG